MKLNSVTIDWLVLGLVKKLNDRLINWLIDWLIDWCVLGVYLQCAQYMVMADPSVTMHGNPPHKCCTVPPGEHFFSTTWILKCRAWLLLKWTSQDIKSLWWMWFSHLWIYFLHYDEYLEAFKKLILVYTYIPVNQNVIIEREWLSW